jgi:enoyl-CoA hydratase/carnithine racemase
MSDEQLQEQFAGVVDDVAEHDGELSEGLWLLIDEVFERFAPEAAIASLKLAYRDEPLALHRALKALNTRQAERTIRSALQ